MNNLNFVIRYSKIRRRKNVSQILYQLRRVELIFFYFSIKASLTETFKYFLNIIVMFRYVVGVNEYIIQIYYDTNIQKIGKRLFINH